MKCKLAFYMYKINATFFTVYIYIWYIRGSNSSITLLFKLFKETFAAFLPWNHRCKSSVKNSRSTKISILFFFLFFFVSHLSINNKTNFSTYSKTFDPINNDYTENIGEKTRLIDERERERKSLWIYTLSVQIKSKFKPDRFKAIKLWFKRETKEEKWEVFNG